MNQLLGAVELPQGVISAFPGHDAGSPSGDARERVRDVNVSHVALLAKIDVFAGMDRVALARLVAYFDCVCLEPGEALYVEGQDADAVYIVIAGELEARSRSDAAGQAPAGQIGVGDLFGELEVLDERPRRATVSARRASEVLRLDAKRFRELVQEPGVARAFLRRLSARANGVSGGGQDHLAGGASREPSHTDRGARLRSGAPAKVRFSQLRMRALVLTASMAAVAGVTLAGSEPQAAFALLLFAAVVMWIVDAVPAFAIALALAMAWVLSGLAAPAQALAGFSTPEWLFVVATLALPAAVARCGLLYRIGLLLVRRMPRSLFWQSATLVLVGILMSPLIPQNKARAALVAPLALALAEAQRLQDRSTGAALLGMAAWVGAVPLHFMFINGSPACLLAWGLLPEAERARFDWFGWFLAVVPLGLLTAVGSLLAMSIILKPDAASTLVRSRVDAQLATLRPTSGRELAMLVVLLLTVCGWMFAPALGVHIAVVAAIGLIAAVLTRSFDEKALKELDWNFIVFFAIVLSIGGLATALGVDLLVTGAAQEFLAQSGVGPRGFVLLVALCTLLVRFVLDQMQGVLLFSLALIPTAAVAGVNPWVVIVTILAVSAIWYVPSQTASYLIAYSAGEGRLYSHAQARSICIAYVAVVFAALLVAVEYWHWLGLL